VSLSLNTFVEPYENEQQKNEGKDEAFFHTEDKISITVASGITAPTKLPPERQLPN